MKGHSPPLGSGSGSGPLGPGKPGRASKRHNRLPDRGEDRLPGQVRGAGTRPTRDGCRAFPETPESASQVDSECAIPVDPAIRMRPMPKTGPASGETLPEKAPEGKDFELHLLENAPEISFAHIWLDTIYWCRAEVVSQYLVSEQEKSAHSSHLLNTFPSLPGNARALHLRRGPQCDSCVTLGRMGSRFSTSFYGLEPTAANGRGVA